MKNNGIQKNAEVGLSIPQYSGVDTIKNLSRFSNAQVCKDVQTCGPPCIRMCTDASHGCCEKTCTTKKVCGPGPSTPSLSIKQRGFGGVPSKRTTKSRFSHIAADDDDCCDNWCSGWCGCDNSCPDEETSIMQLQNMKKVARPRPLSRTKSRFSNISVAQIENQCANIHLPGMGPPTYEQQLAYDDCVKQMKKQRIFDTIFDIFSRPRGGQVVVGADAGADANGVPRPDDETKTPWGLIIGIPVVLVVLFLAYKAATATSTGK